MAGEKPDKDSDEKRFNETLKRMLKTPPKPHVPEKRERTETKSKRGQAPRKKSDSQN